MKKLLFLLMFMAITSLSGCAFMAQATGHDVNGPYPGGFGIDVYNNTGTHMHVLYRSKEAALLVPGQGAHVQLGYYYDHTYTVVGRIQSEGTFCLAEKSIYISENYNRTPNIIFNQWDFHCPRIRRPRR